MLRIAGEDGMGLREYKKKRDLQESKEPKASLKKQKSASLKFCVQKHAARHLHYDFRLEYKGVLLSWAVPKGPPLDTKDKRLAIRVEDHPIGYIDFEGEIPKGNYGAGTVEIWDKGTYDIQDCSTRYESEAALDEGLEKGHFSITLHGKKLKGGYVFQKFNKDNKDKSWLLIKI